MKIYMVCDDWNCDAAYFLSRENAEAARKNNFEKFRDEEYNWHRGEVDDDDFYIIECDVEDG